MRRSFINPVYHDILHKSQPVGSFLPKYDRPYAGPFTADYKGERLKVMVPSSSNVPKGKRFAFDLGDAESTRQNNIHGLDISKAVPYDFLLFYFPKFYKGKKDLSPDDFAIMENFTEIQKMVDSFFTVYQQNVAPEHSVNFEHALAAMKRSKVIIAEYKERGFDYMKKYEEEIGINKKFNLPDDFHDTRSILKSDRTLRGRQLD